MSRLELGVRPEELGWLPDTMQAVVNGRPVAAADRPVPTVASDRTMATAVIAGICSCCSPDQNTIFWPWKSGGIQMSRPPDCNRMVSCSTIEKPMAAIM